MPTDIIRLTNNFVQDLLTNHIRTQANDLFAYIVRQVENHKGLQNTLKPENNGGYYVAKYTSEDGFMLPPNIPIKGNVDQIMLYMHCNTSYFVSTIMTGPFTGMHIFVTSVKTGNKLSLRIVLDK